MYELHPFCVAFRRANAREKAEIVASMKASGYDQGQPITLYDGKILDGGTRQDCAIEAGVQPTFTTFSGPEDEAMALVVRRNKARKHMTMGELDLACARLVTARRGQQPGRPSNNSKSNLYRDTSSTSSLSRTSDEVAKEAGRGQVTIYKARELLSKAAPNIIEMVERGEIGTSSAADGIRGKSKELQATLTADDLHRERRERDKAKAKPAKAKRPKFTGWPILRGGGEVEEQKPTWEHPVHLQPFHTQKLQDAAIRLTAAAGTVRNAARIDVDQLLADLAALAAYVPVKGKHKMEARDFAAEAADCKKRMLAEIDAAWSNLTNLCAELHSKQRASA